jgi:NADPH:quinone reductase-like Zn-dependent oxidoreductase
MDWKFRSGNVLLARLMSGIVKPRNQLLGVEISGRIETIGKSISSFKVGDFIYGVLKGGGYAEYICLPENQIQIAPKSISLDEAATIPFGATTAYHFLVDLGKIKKGEHVLINGASGGVGIFALQIAKHFGAHVTGVCSEKNAQLVKSLGADVVLDYNKEDFTHMNQKYDIIFDVVGNTTYGECKRLLNDGGRF